MQTILIGLDTRINNYASVDLMQGYNYTLEAHITDNYKDVDLTGVTVQLQMQKPDKKFIIQTENIIIEGNKIKATLDKDFTREDGQAKLQVVLLKDNFTFGSWVVKAKIKPSAINDNDGQSENRVTITEALVNKISEAENTKIELDKSIANGDVATIKGNVDKIKDVEIPKINEQLETNVRSLNKIVTLNVDDFLTEDTLNIDDLTSALTSNMAIYFPKNRVIKIDKAIKIRGLNNIYINGNFSTIQTLVECNAFDIQGTDVNYIENVKIENLNIDGCKIPTYSFYITGIKACYIHNFNLNNVNIKNISCLKTSAGSLWMEYIDGGVLENINIYNSASNGVFGNYCSNITLRKVYVDDTLAQNAFYFPRRAINILVDNCTSLNSADGAIEFGDDTKEDIYDLHSKDCVVKNSYLKSRYGIYMSGGFNHKIINNTVIIDSKSNFGGLSIQNNSMGAIIDGNTIINKGSTNGAFCMIVGDDSEPGDSVRNCVIKNNKCYGKGMLVHFKGNVVQDCIVKDNVFSSLIYNTINSINSTDTFIELSYNKEFEILVGDYCSIDNELIKVTNVSMSKKTTSKREYDIITITVERGVNNTVADTHESNNLLYVVGSSLKVGSSNIGIFINKEIKKYSNITVKNNTFNGITTGIVATNNINDVCIIGNQFNNVTCNLWSLSAINNCIIENNIENKSGALYSNTGIYTNGIITNTKIYNNEMKITLNDNVSSNNDYALTAPTSGTWNRGDIVYNYRPVELGNATSKYIVQGWLCTSNGTPGTWYEMRFLTGN